MTREEAQAELAKLTEWFAQFETMTQAAPNVQRRAAFLEGFLTEPDSSNAVEAVVVDG